MVRSKRRSVDVLVKSREDMSDKGHQISLLTFENTESAFSRQGSGVPKLVW